MIYQTNIMRSLNNLVLLAAIALSACTAPLARELAPTAGTLHPTLPAPTKVTVSAQTADGSTWYAFDEYDDIGGSSLYAQHLGLFRSIRGQVSHYDIAETIRALKAAPDGSLYIAAGCGVLHFHDEKMDVLAGTNCENRTFTQNIYPFDLAIASNGDIWVGGIFALARYDSLHHIWSEYTLPARRVLAAPDGSVWTEGWDGVAGSDCCFAHVMGDTWVTYTHTAVLPVSTNLAIQIIALRH